MVFYLIITENETINGNMKITKERWVQAQIEERKFHNETYETGHGHYRDSYQQYFKYLNIDTDVKKVIMEVGCADFPATHYCTLHEKVYLVEPMPSDILKYIMSTNDKMILLNQPFEEIKDLPKVDEVWFLNVLQHVLDPDYIINKAKEIANVIRFFEPINAPINVCHPHEFTLEYFKAHFPTTQHYPRNNTAINFHQWECAYGVWEK